MLANIVAHQKKQIIIEESQQPLAELIKRLDDVPVPRDFYHSLSTTVEMAMIGEVKKASPSKGLIKADFNPVELAQTYEVCHVNAVSVLTEERFFQGQKRYLSDIHKAVSLPLLRKDFILEPYQVYQARVLRADAILLIARILDDKMLSQLIQLSHQLGMSSLVEVHSKEEIDRAVSAGAKIMGINNRDLKTFSTSLQTTEKLISYIPREVLVVSESGINQREDIVFLQKLGVKAVLIGEAFMRAPSIREKVRELKGCVDLDSH